MGKSTDTATSFTSGVDHLLKEGLSSGAKRDFVAAVLAFQRVIQIAPESHEAYFNLGVALRGRNELTAAIAAFEKAVELNPDWPEARFNLGNSYRDAGRREEAIRSYEVAVEKRPTYLKALNNLAVQYFEQGQLSQAEQLLVKALNHRNDYSEGLFNLGRIYRRQKRLADAVNVTAKAAALQPKNTKFRLKLAELQKLQGQPQKAKETLDAILLDEPMCLEALLAAVAMQRDQNKLAEALILLDQAIQRGLVNADVLWQRADVYRIQGKLELALQDLDTARQLGPESANVENLLGVVWFAKGDPARAVEFYQRAVVLKPDMFEAYNNLGAALQAIRRYQESLIAFHTSLQIKPDFAVAHLNRSLSLLREGDYQLGWREFEWRFHCHEYRLTFNNRPTWVGGNLEGKTILLRSEQGLGDTLQFIRYARLLKDRGAKVLVECQSAVQQLVSMAPGVDQAIARGKPLPHIDYQIPMMSLPAALGSTLATIPSEVPYLKAIPEKVEHWREKLNSLGQFKVAISWQGNKKFQADHMRSLPLSCYKRLAEIPGVSLVSIQKNEGTEQLQHELGFPVHHFTDVLDGSGPFQDTAAIMSACDLVITSDTAVAHLAGGLARPTWLALHYAADWRWMSHGDASPWYPTMRLFRQERFGDWESVFGEMCDNLSQVVAGDLQRLKPTVPSIPPVLRIEVSAGELLDKISILEIKSERITHPQKVGAVLRELESLRATAELQIKSSQRLHALEQELKIVNTQLWEIEDAIRVKEQRQDFGAEFIQLARSVYTTNDKRSEIKRKINQLAGSAIQEQKSYASYKS